MPAALPEAPAGEATPDGDGVEGLPGATGRERSGRWAGPGGQGRRLVDLLAGLGSRSSSEESGGGGTGARSPEVAADPAEAIAPATAATTQADPAEAIAPATAPAARWLRCKAPAAKAAKAAAPRGPSVPVAPAVPCLFV